jgi:hypothetical protein
MGIFGSDFFDPGSTSFLGGGIGASLLSRAGGGDDAPGVSTDEQELMDALKRLALNQPELFDQLRKLYTQTSPQMREMGNLLSLEQARYKSALEGGFQDPYMERQLARQRRIGTEEVGRQFGPRNFLKTTGGARAFGDIAEREVLGRYQARQGALERGSRRTLGLAQFENLRRQQNLQGLSSLYQPGVMSAALLPYQQQRGLDLAMSLYNQQQQAGIFGGLGSLLGAGVGGYFGGSAGAEVGAGVGGGLGYSLA